jgi:hypothetical protein
MGPAFGNVRNDGEIHLSDEVPMELSAPNRGGDVNASGLLLDGDADVNGAYGESEVTSSLSVESSSGDVNLRLAD